MTTQAGTSRFLQQTPHGFSNIVDVTGGRLIFITGQMALDSSGNLVGPGDYRAQLQQAFENLETQLAAVGATFHHVVKLTVMAEQGFTDHVYEFGEVRDSFVNLANPPASAIILAPKLIHPLALVDIAAIAHLPE